MREHVFESVHSPLAMCKSCGSMNLREFTGEIAIHFSGLKNVNRPAVCVFPRLAICLACGSTDFSVPEDELRLLRNDDQPEPAFSL